MKKITKRILSAILCAAVFCSLSAGVSAADGLRIISDIPEATVDTQLPGVLVSGTVTKEDDRIFLQTTGSSDPRDGVVLMISDETKILDAVTGMPVSLSDIDNGDTLSAYTGPAMTMSLPPISNALVILCNVPADGEVPAFYTVKDAAVANGSAAVTATDGTKLTIGSGCALTPYLTKNIVTLDNLKEGAQILVWNGDNGALAKVMFFAPDL